jgi:putative membrane protein
VTEYPVMNALVFVILGTLVYLAALVVAAKLAPFDVWKQVIEERNVPAAIVAGAVALGLAWIVAATMH